MDFPTAQPRRSIRVSIGVAPGMIPRICRPLRGLKEPGRSCFHRPRRLIRALMSPNAEQMMQARMLLVLPMAALFIACAEAPNSTSRRTNRLAFDGPPRIDRPLGSGGWTINAPLPEPLGVAQGATVASGDGSRIYHIGGITGA